MDALKQKFFDKATKLQKEVKTLLKKHGDKVVDEVTLKQVFGGARGIKMMIWETSQLDPVSGIHFRGFSIPELKEVLPKGECGRQPRPEGLFWLMLTGDVPTDEEVDWLTDQWTNRSNVPKHTFDVIDSLPVDSHPMSQFSIAISSMQSESIFARRYTEGLQKTEYWRAVYEDTMNLIARLPRIAAYIYRRVIIMEIISHLTFHRTGLVILPTC